MLFFRSVTKQYGWSTEEEDLVSELFRDFADVTTSDRDKQHIIELMHARHLVRNEKKMQRNTVYHSNRNAGLLLMKKIHNHVFIVIY